MPQSNQHVASYGNLLHEDADLRRIVRFKARLLRELRLFLYERHAHEVPMPVLQRFREGAPVDQWSTTDPVTGERWFLRHCMEDHLRRMTPVFPRVFEIGKAVRAERRSTAHASEFLVLELCLQDASYEDGINFIRDMVAGPVATVVEAEYGSDAGLREITRVPWDDISAAVTGRRWGDPDFRIRVSDWLRNAGLVEGDHYIADWEFLEDVMKYVIEPSCREPTIVTHFPQELQHVCEIDSETGSATRFSLVMNGVEFADGGLKFSDSAGYRRIYERNAAYRRDTLRLDGNELPEDFFAELDRAASTAFTCGFGIDRLTALVAGCDVSRAIQFVDG